MVTSMTKSAANTYMMYTASPLLGMRTRMCLSIQKLSANRFVNLLRPKERNVSECYLSPPSPLRGTHPCPMGRKWMLGHCRNTVITISSRQQTVPLRQGEKVDARSLQEYCDYNFIAPANCPPETGGTRSEVTEGVDKTTHYYLDYLSTPSPLRGTPPVSGGESGCSAIAGTLSPLFPVVTIPLSCRGIRGESGFLGLGESPIST